MHRSMTAALAAALCLALTYGIARGDAPAAVKDARDRLGRGDARGAVAVLEAQLPGATADARPALLDALRDAYTAAARQADSEGKTAEAESFRDDLDILNPRPRTPQAAPAPVPPPSRPVAAAPVPEPKEREVEPNYAPFAETIAPTPTPRRAEAPAVNPPPVPADAARPPQKPASIPDPKGTVAVEPGESLAPLPPVVNPVDAPPALAAPEAPPAEMPMSDPAVRPASTSTIPNPAPRASEEDEPASAPTPAATKEPLLREIKPPTPQGPTLAAAVDAFKAERYDEAGKAFAALNRDGKLPPDFKSHWAYCRAADVVRRINARPATPQEWAAIDAEIQAIRDLSPSNWFAEYLRNLASERNRDPKARSARSNKVVVRGSSPDEPPLGQGPGSIAVAQATAPARIAPPTPMPVPQIPWSRQPVESANFVVIHVEKDRALAERAVRAAEATRETQVKRWGSGSEAWTPRCEIVLYPTARDFARETLQPPDSPGVSTMGMAAGKVVLRRVNLRTDHPNMVAAVLPHEVTHVVLADLFPNQQIPRWADEGMAVLAEPRSEQATRAADLDEPLRTGHVFRAGDLMSMTQYPKPEFWGLYYAQSVSLTRFLVETGSPAQFIRFVQQSQQSGVETALRQVYSISSFGELQNRWLAYARETSTASAALTASSTDPEKNPATPRQ